uniref:Uncharacterized protein n=1 Tax=Chromera velia CCMP2878 TaxID=1169474 RepID=A0A0G4FU12_9ALVE|eukprot:Cvel_3718.t1-p1 / transcript=Cvel_3718.t1 / gene=Cvel_3718 / organism=Chromera_velia_CCMP2878 / gene_product=F-box-like/WD repeat-containing protein TBL1X, putative / transcript_product=F-box-like/WD repeat-containing protein TBL1X, putative / location=Cvel_scaffold154:108298-110637(+) / protein_length=780 / sequence_SO=supercontig / SO=protein_coding / is_pseudo=false
MTTEGSKLRRLPFQLTTEDINFLVYRYLFESGFSNTADTFLNEANLVKPGSYPTKNDPIMKFPPGALIAVLQKALMWSSVELHVRDDGSFLRCGEALSFKTAHRCDEDAREEQLVPPDVVPRIFSAQEEVARRNGAVEDSHSRKRRRLQALRPDTGWCLESLTRRKAVITLSLSLHSDTLPCRVSAASVEEGIGGAGGNLAVSNVSAEGPAVLDAGFSPCTDEFAVLMGDGTLRLWRLDRVQSAEKEGEGGDVGTQPFCFLVCRHLKKKKEGTANAAAAAAAASSSVPLPPQAAEETDPSFAEPFARDARGCVWFSGIVRADTPGELLPPPSIEEMQSVETDAVSCFAWSPLGNVLATAGSDSGLIRVWEKNGDVVQMDTPKPCRLGGVVSVGFSQSGNLLASLAADGSVCVHSVADGKVLLYRKVPKGGIPVGKPHWMGDQFVAFRVEGGGGEVAVLCVEGQGVISFFSPAQGSSVSSFASAQRKGEGLVIAVGDCAGFVRVWEDSGDWTADAEMGTEVESSTTLCEFGIRREGAGSGKERRFFVPAGVKPETTSLPSEKVEVGSSQSEGGGVAVVGLEWECGDGSSPFLWAALSGGLVVQVEALTGAVRSREVPGDVGEGEEAFVTETLVSSPDGRFLCKMGPQAELRVQDCKDLRRCASVMTGGREGQGGGGIPSSVCFSRPTDIGGGEIGPRFLLFVSESGRPPSSDSHSSLPPTGRKKGGQVLRLLSLWESGGLMDAEEAPNGLSINPGLLGREAPPFGGGGNGGMAPETDAPEK